MGPLRSFSSSFSWRHSFRGKVLIQMNQPGQQQLLRPANVRTQNPKAYKLTRFIEWLLFDRDKESSHPLSTKYPKTLYGFKTILGFSILQFNFAQSNANILMMTLAQFFAFGSTNKNIFSVIMRPSYLEE